MVDNASFRTLPHRDQIGLLVIARIVEPFTYNSISPYIYYMVKDFGYNDPATISRWVTIITTSFSLGQGISGVFWGRFSDTRGRKPTLLLGLIGTLIAVLVFGTSTTVAQALLGRFLMGVLNGNVGVMRTMIAELVGSHKEHQTRAFAILPITANIGTVIGPLVGGLLAGMAKSPDDREDGIFKTFPYLLPNLFPLPLCLFALITGFLFIEETSENPTALMARERDPGLKLGRKLKKLWSRRSSEYTALEDDSDITQESQLDELVGDEFEDNWGNPECRQSEEFERVDSLPQKPVSVLTRPVKITLISYIFLMLQAPAFMQLLPLFLSTPVRPPGEHTHFPFQFSGGMGLSTKYIGVVISVLGLVGAYLQLAWYPSIASKIGVAQVHRRSLLVFPIAYAIIPYLSYLGPLGTIHPWIPSVASAIVAMSVVLARTFAIPPMVVLMTNATSSRDALGRVHGITISVTSIARCIGPFILGNLYSLGVQIKVIGLVWWVMSIFTIIENIQASKLEEWDEINKPQ